MTIQISFRTPAVNYVYAHYTPDGKVFYIGKGSGQRAWKTQHRNKYWHNIVNKYGYQAKILASNLIEGQANAIEQAWIAVYGRRDLGTGCLVNMTDGGEGKTGARHTAEAKTKMSIAKKGKPGHLKGKPKSAETRMKISIAKRGVKLSETHRLSIAAGNRARPKVITANMLKRSKPIRCVETGVEYKSIREAARLTGLAYPAIQQCIKGSLKTTGGLRWEEV